MKLAQLSTRTLVGGLFGLTLSFVFAETCSDGLFEIYSSSTLFRNVTGNAPNFLANGLNKISWAIFFGACWWMLWKFDLFFTLIPEIKDEGSEESSDSTQGAQSSKNEKEEETFKPENEENKSEKKQTDENHTGDEIFDANDQRFLDVLKITDNKIDNFDSIKSVYRKRIAQYHPDKVLAMGPEIREIAEKKAKEINEAYEHFRKKFSA